MPSRRSIQAARPPLYPIFLDLRGAAVLVVGGGGVAARKVPGLLNAGARVLLVAPQIEPALAELARKHRALRIVRRNFRPSDIKQQRLIIAASSNLSVNRSAAAAARRAGILVNVAAPPDAGDVQIPSVIRRGPLSLAISTGGASAALAAAWRKRLERLLGPEWETWVAELETTRRRILGEIQSEALRRELLQRLGALRWGRLLKSKGLAHTRRAVSALIEKFRKRERAASRRR